MKKKLFSLLLAVAMLLTIVPVSPLASAESATAVGTDYASVAEETYLNLRQNFVDTSTDTLYPVMWGYQNGDTTNLGTAISFSTPSIWESSVVLYAFDTYAQTLDSSSSRYSQIAHTIANTMNWFVDNLSTEELTAVPSSQNIALDDAAWDLCAYMLGYRYNLIVEDSGHADKCLNAASAVFDNIYTTYYDSSDGLLWYTASHETKSMYIAAYLIGGWDLYQVNHSSAVYTKLMNVYNGVETVLRRSDGLYAIEKLADGTVNGADGNYSINFGGSCTYLNANMAMAVLNMRMGNTDKAEATTNAILAYETTDGNVLINDRDAWNDTYFMGMWVREVLNEGIGGDAAFVTLFETADSILREAVFSDGYYSAAWTGPKEPTSAGYPSDYPSGAYRNNWGKYTADTTSVQGGSTPRQCMTSATTAHVILAAAAADREAIEADDGSFSFTGSGDWLDTDVRPDNTKNYDLSCSINLPALAVCSTNNTWCDTLQFVIRNETADNYIKLQVQSYVSGGGQYQTYTTAQLWNGSDWSSTLDNWSANYNSPIDYVNVTVSHNADSGAFVLKVVNAADDTLLNQLTFDGGNVTADLAGCDSCQLRMYRNSTNLIASDCTLVYAESDWEKSAITFSGSGDWLTADVRPDNTKNYEIGYDLFLPKSVAGASNNTWYDEAALKIRDVAEDDYTYFRCQTYINSNGQYQFASAGQMNDGGVWAEQDFQWSSDYSVPVYSVHLTYKYNAASGTYSWSAVNNVTGTVLQSSHIFTGTITPEYAACDSCELQFYRNSTDLEIKNAYIAYEAEETFTPGDFDWCTDNGDFTGWEATDGANLYGTCNRVWKSLLTNPHEFTLEMDVTPAGSTSSAAVKILGVVLELDARNGNGNQVYLKLNGNNVDWFSATGNEVHVKITRTACGSLTYTLTGKDNATLWSGIAAQSEYSTATELLIYAGSASFENISADCAAEVTHSYTASGSAVAATCTTQGYTPAVCSVCGEAGQINVQAALGHDNIYTDNGDTHTVTCSRCDDTAEEAHDFVNGVCVCGAENADVKIKSAYLTLNDNIDVTYAVTVSEDCTDAYMVFTMNGISRTVTDYTEADGKRLYTFTGVTPQHMGDNISAVFYATKDGSSVSDAVAEYSVRQYCANQLAKYAENESLVTLLSDLLTYGAAAQTYCGYNTDNLASAGLDLSPREFTEVSPLRVSFSGTESAAADWNAATLTLRNALAIRLFFEAPSTDGLTVTATLNGRSQTFTAEDFISAGEDTYYVEFCGIKATEFADTLTAGFTLNGEAVGRTISYSVNTYLSGHQNLANDSLQALVRALYNYGVSAAEYTAN